jgi:SNF2 family DNA or RNA helicase
VRRCTATWGATVQVHKESRSLLLRLRNPSAVTNVLPFSRVVQHEGMDLTQVRFGLDEAVVLRNMGIDVPSPIRYFYDFPSRYPAPFDHQVTTSEFFTLNRRGICLNDMGTAKTLSALWAIDYMQSTGHVSKVLITCPKSTMNAVWEEEVTKHLFGRMKVAVLSGSKERRLRELARTDVDVYVVNHEGLATIADALRKRADIDLWVVDEAAKFRNAQSKRHELLADLVRPTDRLWLLTGTPCPQAPTDAWGLAKLLHGPRVNPPFFTRFKNETMTQLSQYKWVAKPDAYQRAYAILQPGIRFKKSDCLDLPPITFQTRMCELSPDQKVAYESMISKLVAEVRGVEIAASNAAIKMAKLLQVCAGVLYDEFGDGHTIDATDRLALCDAVIEEANHKVIVFVPFTAALNAVASHLAKSNTVATVDGSTSDAQRKKIFHDFQNCEHPRILVANPETAAHGLTLTAADTTIWYTPITKLEIFEQANNRMDRPNQDHPMTVVMLAATMMEQNMYQALKGKQNIQNAVLGLYKAAIGLDT